MDTGTSQPGTSERRSARPDSESSSGEHDTPTSVTRPWAPLQERHVEGLSTGRTDTRDQRNAPADTDGQPPRAAGATEHRGWTARLGSLFVVRVIMRYATANGGTMAINIAWNTLFAFFPIILLITTALTAIFGGPEFGNTIDKSIQSALPGNQGAEIVQALHSFHQATGPLLTVSIIGLVWSGTALFSAIDQGLNALYPHKTRSFVRQKLMGVVMIVVFTVLVALGVGSASLINLVIGLPQMPSFMHSAAAATLIQAVFGIVVGMLLFGAIYYIVPNARQRIRDIVPGVLLAAVLLEAFLLLFPLYFKLSHGFSTYGSTFALFFLLLTFAFWVAQITMFGGAVNAELHPPEPGATPEAQAPETQSPGTVGAQRPRG